jgi:putative restriction endonuclease
VRGDFDDRIRAAAFAYLDRLVRASGPWVSRPALEAFEFEGRRVPLVEAMRGIRKPSGMQSALTILTTYAADPAKRPYDDSVGPDGYPRYKWRGTDPDLYDNRGLRSAMELQSPLAWFIGVGPGTYEPVYPVWLVEEEPQLHQFVVALDDVSRDQWSPFLGERSPFDPARRYAEATIRRRLHQPIFRDRVLIAYETQCALCRLRHRELLDAAHIREDSAGGEPVVPNGVSMCAIHHRAFDANVLGIRPDHRVEVRHDVLTERDGPTLRYALQGLHGEVIQLPTHRGEWPDPDLLEERYERFRSAG